MTLAGELTGKQATAFAALVADADQTAISCPFDEMNAEQLRAFAIALATQVNAAENVNGEVADVGPDGICAIATAAQSFGATRDAVLSADRHRAVTDARAVAMTASRPGGLAAPDRQTDVGFSFQSDVSGARVRGSPSTPVRPVTSD